ncbi:MAG: YtxH domain-containing protein [Vicinamibacterales bacterium]
MHIDQHHQDSGGFLFGFALGLAGGAAAALLYAPSEGRQMRSYLADRAKEGREKAMTAAERGREYVHEGREVLDHGREVISTAIHEGREAYRRTKSQEAL